jgi:hypothetical protein
VKCWKNGKCYEMPDPTPEELAEIRRREALARIQERSRPLTESEVLSMLLSQTVQEIEVDDNTALRMKSYYPEWEPGNPYPVGNKLTRNGKLYKVVQSHTAQAEWEPENVPAMFTEICETHSGELDDPIPYSGNMALEQGKYYIQDDEIYICIRESVSPVYHHLSDLIGLYVSTL